MSGAKRCQADAAKTIRCLYRGYFGWYCCLVSAWGERFRTDLSSSGNREPVATWEVFWFCFFPCPYRETEHKPNRSAAKKKNKQTDETQKVLRPHLCLSSRYGAPAALRRIILRSFLKRSIIYIKIYIYMYWKVLINLKQVTWLVMRI